ncbi:MAG: NYN domain-containing protein [Caldilineaceae bacterium]|nr:NYN domain-containing protein [Caldilineaceae bacterium]MDE0432110.1 NYN domain-containing protein [Caldilineaceae bacterium]
MSTNFDGRDARLLAMLIDGDNAQPKLLEQILAEVAKHGLVTTRRIYGDWTEPQMSGWKNNLHSFAVQPVQQFRYTVGKNATDSALIIEAMDLLHSGSVHGFCIVSSDSDYTRLATRIRESGLFVMGIGRSNTPKSFVNACEVFVYTENLTPKKDKGKKNKEKPSTEWIELVSQAVDMASREDGWTLLSVVGINLQKLDPAFDTRTFGYAKLSQLIESHSAQFELKRESSHYIVRFKG